MKKRRSPQKRITFLSLVSVAILVVAVSAYFLVANKNTNSTVTNNPIGNSDTQKTSNSNNSGVDAEEQTPETPTPQQSTELLVKEWGVETVLPADMQDMVTYSLGEVSTDPDDNQIQAAKIFVKSSALPGNICTTINTSLGASVDIGTQYIRSETSKPFNAERYRWTFKENVLATDQYNYHLNYLTPDCVGASSDRLEALQKTLINLTEVE